MFTIRPVVDSILEEEEDAGIAFWDLDGFDGVWVLGERVGPSRALSAACPVSKRLFSSSVYLQESLKNLGSPRCLWGS